jgi:eukaryotic-like serine/threonine-protein kinase
VDQSATPLPPPAVPGLTGLTVLARGGYATVYRATQESVGREVAVKVENRAFSSERDQRRFLREARASGRMSSHPHVVDLFDAGMTPDGHPYLIMELCDGSYADRIKTLPLSAGEAREVGMKIADALADAHALGVLHRDVKPANILISRFGEPALADFGLAVLAETRDTSITLEVLTPAYAPREMFRAGTPPSPAADVYSLCATLYALLRGRPPRWQDDRNPSLVTLLELFERPVPDLPGVPAVLLEVLRSGMTNEPGARPSAVTLRDLLAGLPLPAGTPPSQSAGSIPVAGGAPVVGPAALNAVTVAVPVQDRPSANGPQWTGPTHPIVPPPRREPDPEATQRKRRWWPFAGAGAAVLTLGLLVGGATWYGLDHRAAARARPPAAGRSVAGRSTSLAPSRGACGVAAVGGTCPASATCFGRMTVSHGVASAKSLSCRGTHTWEVFAIGTLPSGLATVDYQAVRGTEAVQGLCNSVTLGLVDLGAVAWQIDVLPPTPDAYAAGERTFRCLAGKGVNSLHQPVFYQ